MDYSKNIKAFLSTLPLDKMRGDQKFLAVAVHCASNSDTNISTTTQVKGSWPRAILKIKYNPAYYHEAQTQGWVNAIGPGKFLVTEEGLQFLHDISGLPATPLSPGAAGLYVFDRGSTHTFDKFLRTILSDAKTEVLIADSYVDDTIFDTVLDSIRPTSLKIKLIYGRQMGTFTAKVTRFKRQYTAFDDRKYSKLHDRFILVDGKGYVIGPSIKDAADRHPALVVKLSGKDSSELVKFFKKLWAVSV